MVSAIPLFQAGASAEYDERKWQLPAPYREALTQVEQALRELKRAVDETESEISGVEVLFQ